MPAAERIALLCETDTRTVEKQVRAAASGQQRIPSRHLSSVFEHGQWWVEDRRNGAQWSVCDTNTGFCFEQVTPGDGD